MSVLMTYQLHVTCFHVVILEQSTLRTVGIVLCNPVEQMLSQRNKPL